MNYNTVFLKEIKNSIDQNRSESIRTEIPAPPEEQITQTAVTAVG